MELFQVPEYVKEAYKKNEQSIAKSKNRLFLPHLPETPDSNSANYKVVFKTKKFAKSKTRIMYKNRARAILSNAVLNHGNINQLIDGKFKSLSDLGKCTKRFKTTCFSKSLTDDVLLRRDRWIQCIYFTLHKLNVFSSELSAQVNLASEDDKSDTILGLACHAKGWNPYFPEFCYTGGLTEYPFENKKHKTTKSELEGHVINPCIDNCILASEGQAHHVLDIIERCRTLDRKQLRDFLMNLDKCPDVRREPYQLTVEKRNHPRQCYGSESSCTSGLVLLRKLYPHYNNVRKLYKLLSDLKQMHEMIADLDAAMACGDFDYLGKLLAFSPPEKASKVHNVERPNSIVTLENLIAKYGKHVLTFIKDIENLPKTACICCEKLTDNEHILQISNRWRNIGNPAWQQLLAYLNCNSRIVTRGEIPVDTLVGQAVCRSCSNELNKNKIPTISIINGMDTGTQPNCIRSLSAFESIFIHLAMCYQTIVKLSPMGAQLPYSARMDKLKGFAVHITQPLDNTLTELFGNRPTKLVNPDEHIVLHGIPKKDRTVWQRLVSVEKIHSALVWLKQNNPLYREIVIPENPIDLLPPDPKPLSKDEVPEDAGKCEFTDSDIASNVRSTFSDDSDKSLPFFNIVDDMPQGPTTAPASANSSGNDECFSDKIDPYSDNDLGDRGQVDNNPELQNINPQNKRQRKQSGGCHKDKNINAASDTIIENDSSEVEVLREDEIDKLNAMASQIEKLKYLTVKKALGYARELSTGGHICHDCDIDLRNTRTRLSLRLGTEYSAVNYKSLDLPNMIELVSIYKTALHAGESTLLTDICTLCPLKPMNKPEKPMTKKLSRKRCRKLQKIAQNVENHQSEIQQIREKQIEYLTEIDNLRTDGYLCVTCHTKSDRKCEVSTFNVKSKRKLLDKIQMSSIKEEHCFKRLSIFRTVFDKFQEAGIKNTCVRCNEHLGPKNRIVPSLSDNVNTECASLSQSKPYDHRTNGRNELSFTYTDEHKTEFTHIGTTQVHGSRAHSANLLRTLTVNRAYIRSLIQIMRLVKHHKACCETCTDSVERTLKTYKELMSGSCSKLSKFEGDKSLKVYLEYVDVEVFRSLLLDSLDKLRIAKSNGKCFDCSVKLMRMKSDNDLIDHAVWDSFEQSILYTIDYHSNSASTNQKNERLHGDFIMTGGDGSVDMDSNRDEGPQTMGSDDDDEENVMDGEGENPENTEDVRKLIEQMSEDDFNNLIAHYTVTCLDGFEDNPQWLDNLYQLLRIDDDPISLQEPNLDVMCFPEVFPWGVGGRNAQEERVRKVGPLQFERTRLLSKHGNIRRNVPYIFSMGQENERRKITQGVYASLKNVRGLKDLTTKEFFEKMKSNDPDLQRRLSRSVRDIPGTAQYWRHQKQKIDSMCERHGPPTWFSTFSPAEYDWEDLVQYIRDVNADIPGVQNLSSTEILAKDPVLVSNYIHRRFAAILKLILSDANPIGKVTNYFIRTEYQGRGVAHFHCIFWIDGAPVIGRDSDKDVAAFIQRYASCKLPDRNEEPRLYDMVDKYQRHKCREYCLRLMKSCGKWKRVCRFGFPRPESRLFQLHDVLSCVIGRRKNKMKKRLYDLARTGDESYINDYNPELLLLWGGNMDIQFLSEDSFSIAEYVTKYVLKSEQSHLDSFVPDDSESAFQRSSKFAYENLRNREMSSHEAIDRMLQNNGQLYKVSDSFVFVPTTFPRYRTRCIKQIKQLEGQDSADTNIYAPDYIHDFYPRRPSDLENISLHDFVEKYEKTYGSSTSSRLVIEIKDEAGDKIVGRLKERPAGNIPIVQHCEFDVKKHPESFYYSYLCLFKPWRQEVDIMGPSTSYQEEFFRVLNQFPDMKTKYERCSTRKRLREEMEKRADMEINREDPEEADPLAKEVDNDDPVINQALQDFECVNSNSEIRTEGELENFISTLNTDQRRIYDLVTSNLLHSYNHDLKLCNCADYKPLLLYCSGFGGTGKTYLIKALIGFMYVQKHVFNRPLHTVLGAPTGLAADNIKGQTLHSAFNIPVEHGSHPKYVSLTKPALHQSRAVMSDLKCVIIDEVSMVSNVTLLLIHLRLTEIFGSSQPFANKNVILFGDLLQLPPVQASSPFRGISDTLMNKVTGGNKVALNLWREFQFDELTINQRQAGDENARWKDLLYRVRTGTHTVEDIKLLNDHCIDIPSTVDKPDEKLDIIVDYFIKLSESGSNPVCLLATREMVDRFNSAVMGKYHDNVEEVSAIDYIDCKNKKNVKAAEKAVSRLDKLDDPRNTAGLEKSLPLAVGVKVMLRNNIDVKQGLVNGAIGTVTGFQKAPHTGKITSIKIRFNNLSEDVAIKPVRRKVQIFPGAFLHREQFPLCLSYAMTVHKSQGLTLQCALIDLGKTIFAQSQAYVALSRLNSIAGLHLINFDPRKILINTSSLEEYVRLGSKSGISQGDRVKLRNKSNRQLKSFKLVGERVWYISSSRKKAEATINSKLPKTPENKATGREKSNTNFPGKGKLVRGDKASKTPDTAVADPPNNGEPSTVNRPGSGKNPRKVPTKPNVLIRPSFYLIPVDGPRTINEITRLIDLSVNRDMLVAMMPLALDRHAMLTTYQAVIARYSDRLSDQLVRRLAVELHPDPFGIGYTTQKWLSSDVMNVFGAHLRDLWRGERGMPSVYYLSSNARYNYINHRDECVHRYIQSAHAAIPFSSYFYSRNQYSIKAGLEFEGDPLERDMIINFCNDRNNHWYLLVMDTRSCPMTITHYDSGSFSTNNMEERGKYLVRFLNLFRNNASAVYQLNWQVRPHSRAEDYIVRNGESVRQGNGYDCGVFSLVNAECAVRGWDHSRLEQTTIPFMRLRLIREIVSFLDRAGVDLFV